MIGWQTGYCIATTFMHLVLSFMAEGEANREFNRDICWYKCLYLVQSAFGFVRHELSRYGVCLSSPFIPTHPRTHGPIIFTWCVHGDQYFFMVPSLPTPIRFNVSTLLAFRRTDKSRVGRLLCCTYSPPNLHTWRSKPDYLCMTSDVGSNAL